MNNSKLTNEIEKHIYKKGETIVEEIIDQSYRIFCNKLSNGGLKVKNETAFQCELGIILKTLGSLYEFRPDDKFQISFENHIDLNTESIKSKSKRARIDIQINYSLNGKTTKAAIELKFYKKKNQREPNNRYDVFKDISNLEKYKDNGIDLCFFILATDHTHYVNKQKYSANTSDFDFRHGAEYQAGKMLSYKTEKPYGEDITLEQNYNFHWGNVEDLYFLKVEV